MALARRAKRDASNHSRNETGRPRTTGWLPPTVQQVCRDHAPFARDQGHLRSTFSPSGRRASKPRVALIDLRAVVALDIGNSPAVPKLSDAAFGAKTIKLATLLLVVLLRAALQGRRALE